MSEEYSIFNLGITFDLVDYNAVFGCKANANSDIAGYGTIFSFAIAALITTTASIAAAVLDTIAKDENAFLWLPKWLHSRLEHRFRTQQDLCKRVRKTLDRLILAFADQQLVTGFALLICGYVFTWSPVKTSPWDMPIMHWNQVVYLACLSSSTHLACVLTLRKYFKNHRQSALLRLALIVLFSLFLIPSIIMSYAFRAFLYPFFIIWNDLYNIDYQKLQGGSSTAFAALDGLWYGLQSFTLAYFFYAAIMQLVPEVQDRTKDMARRKIWPRILPMKHLEKHNRIYRCLSATFWYFVFLTPGTVFVLQICFALSALVYAFCQKFMAPEQALQFPFGVGGAWCTLHGPGENDFGFGQLLTLLLLGLPILQAWETYMEELQKQKRKKVEEEQHPTSLTGTCGSDDDEDSLGEKEDEENQRDRQTMPNTSQTGVSAEDLEAGVAD